MFAALCTRNMDYLEPAKGSKIKLAIVIVAATFIGSVSTYLWSLYSNWIKTLPLCDSIFWLERGIDFVAIAGILISIWPFRTGYLIIKHKQFPYPGATVYRRTKIRKGQGAYLRGIVFIILGLALVVVGTGIIYVFDLLKIAGIRECG